MNKSRIKKILAIIMAVSILAAALVFASCSGNVLPPDEKQTDPEEKTENPGSETPGSETPVTPTESKVKLNFGANGLEASDKSGISIDGNKYYIIKSGEYELSGVLENGQIIVSVSKSDQVNLILNNFTATCTFSGPIYVKSADKVVIELEKNTTNTLTDANVYSYGAGETKPNACIYSSDDLTIKGDGTLIVNGKFNNGIGCKNDIKIKGGNIIVTALKNAIKGNESITVEGGVISVISAVSGLKADDIEKDGKGFIKMTAGSVNISASGNAINASNLIDISGGSITINNCKDGIKAYAEIVDPSTSKTSSVGEIKISGGDINITSTDDALQASDSITVSGGSVNVSAEGKAVNCKNFNGEEGTVNITEGCLTEN